MSRVDDVFNSSKKKNPMEKLRKIAARCNELVVAAREDIAAGEDPEDVWEKVHKFVFSEQISSKVFSLMIKAGKRFDYYDPDTSYEEDTLAFINALTNYCREDA